MKKTHRELPFLRNNALTERVFDEKALIFDIETTGFSPKSACVYLIGCAFRKGGGFCVEQYFADSPSEEGEILTAFLAVLDGFDTLISFNGAGFDIPFLRARCERFGLLERFEKLHHLDLYRSVSGLKFLFRLPDCRQKTVERFLELRREDKADGGDLIDVYKEYVKCPDAGKSRLLHLHNFEDVTGLTELLSVLAYQEIFDGGFSVLSCSRERYLRYDRREGEEILITLLNSCPAPRQVSCKVDDFVLNVGTGRTTVRVPIFWGRLRYFYENYRDYYYLPAEDMAVHKSVASFVDRSYRKAAKASNCYINRDGAFLPQMDSVMQPEFRMEYRDKKSWFELTDDFCSSFEQVERYARHILTYVRENGR